MPFASNKKAAMYILELWTGSTICPWVHKSARWHVRSFRMFLYEWMHLIFSQQLCVPGSRWLFPPRPWILGDTREPQVSMATRLLHHFSPAAVVRLVFGQALRQPNSDSTLATDTELCMPKLSLSNSSDHESRSVCSNISRWSCLGLGLQLTTILIVD